jgi:hypothetical protein
MEQEAPRIPSTEIPGASLMKERDFKVGETVIFDKILLKDRNTMRHDEITIRGRGTLVGFRTVHDMGLDREDGYYIKRSHRVALVADDLYTSPNKVPFESLYKEPPK